MTLKELSQVYYLRGEIAEYERRLQELEAKRGISALNMDGMPHSSMNSSQVEQLAADIADIEAIIHAKRIECIHEQVRLERYIAEIPDSMTRSIFQYRFLRCMTWNKVADHIGGDNTADSVRMICKRYLDREEK